jgi:PII-like signaling protein
MQLHRKKRIEIIAEAAIVPTLIETLRAQGASGYTVIPAILGSGHAGAWSESAMNTAMQMQLVLVIASPGLADSLVEQLRPLVAEYKAILMISEVEVIRGDHFA